MANNSGKNIQNIIAQKITPSLWVEKDAKAVADYYLSIFKGWKPLMVFYETEPIQAKRNLQSIKRK